MKIARLECKNCLGISEFQLTPGKVNLIKGGNREGKTSILDTIQKGIKNTTDRPVFVKRGEDGASIYIEFDDGTAIERSITPDGKGDLKVIKDGFKANKPQTYLDKLFGKFSFNPVDFMGRKDTEQADILLSLVPIEVTQENLFEWFQELIPVNCNLHGLKVCKEAEAYWYNRRAVANKEVKTLAAQCETLQKQLPDNYKADDWRDVSLGAIYTRIDTARQANMERAKAMSVIDSREKGIKDILNQYDATVLNIQKGIQTKAEKEKKESDSRKLQIRFAIEDIDRKIAELMERKKGLENTLGNEDSVLSERLKGIEGQQDILIKNAEKDRDRALEGHNQKVFDAQEYINNNPYTDTAPIEQEAQETERMKGFLTLADNAKRLEGELILKQAETEKYNEYVNFCRRKPSELLAQHKLPVEGLGINDEGNITINGLPIKNQSTSEQVEIALDIARNTSGPLHIICVDKFENLDPETQQEFFRQIENDDFQYFVTDISRDFDEDGNYMRGLRIETKGAIA